MRKFLALELIGEVNQLKQRLAEREKEIERLRGVLKYVTEYSNDPGVEREAQAALERRDEGERA